MTAGQLESEIFCEQTLQEDWTVFSIQWGVFPRLPATVLTPGILLCLYLDFIRRCTAGTIRPFSSPDGIEFRVAGSRLSLISLLPPSMDEKSVSLRICAGLLVHPRQGNRGELSLSLVEVGDGLKITLQLSGYVPLLLGNPPYTPFRRWLYRRTQAAVHRLVTVRFLAALYRNYVSPAARIRVVDTRIREGRPV